MEALAGVTPPGHTVQGSPAAGVFFLPDPGNTNGVKIKMNIMVMLSWRGDILSAWATIYIHNGAAHHVCYVSEGGE